MILSEKNTVEYVTRNPGLTAAMMAKCIHSKYGTTSSALYLLCKAGKLKRIEMIGERGSKAWRYFPL